jgi:hypothetical protein
VKNSPTAAKFLTILDVSSVSVVVATNEMAAGVRRLTAGFLGGAWLFTADGAASKPAMPGRLSRNKSLLDSALNHAAAGPAGARGGAFCVRSGQPSIVSTT